MAEIETWYVSCHVLRHVLTSASWHETVTGELWGRQDRECLQAAEERRLLRTNVGPGKAPKNPAKNGDFHSHGGTPIAGWFVRENLIEMDDD